MRGARCVIYLTSGKPHLPYLIVSLYTLRQYWFGPIQVFAWPESIDLVRKIAKDDRLRIKAFAHEPYYRREDGVKGNAQFLDKIDLMRSVYGEVNLYLDCDTIVNGSLVHLFKMSDRFGFCATQFNDWKSNSRMPRKRISRLLDVEGINQESVLKAMNNPLPSVS